MRTRATRSTTASGREIGSSSGRDRDRKPSAGDRWAALALVGLAALVGLVGCSDDEPVAVTTTTVEVLGPDEFSARIDEVCGAAAADAAAFDPATAVSTEEAAAALRGLANITFESVAELGTIRPEEGADDYQRWLEVLFRVATQVDAGAAALQAGEVPAGIAQLESASATSAQASELGVGLGLERCQFLDPAAAAPSTTVLPG